jgi:hypothetical protein
MHGLERILANKGQQRGNAKTKQTTNKQKNINTADNIALLDSHCLKHIISKPSRNQPKVQTNY